MAFDSRMERGYCFRSGGVGPVGAAFVRVLQSFSKMAVDKTLWGEYDLSIFNARFQEVADFGVRLFADHAARTASVRDMIDSWKVD